MSFVEEDDIEACLSNWKERRKKASDLSKFQQLKEDFKAEEEKRIKEAQSRIKPINWKKHSLSLLPNYEDDDDEDQKRPERKEEKQEEEQENSSDRLFSESTTLPTQSGLVKSTPNSHTNLVLLSAQSSGKQAPVNFPARPQYKQPLLPSKPLFASNADQKDVRRNSSGSGQQEGHTASSNPPSQKIESSSHNNGLSQQEKTSNNAASKRAPEEVLYHSKSVDDRQIEDRNTRRVEITLMTKSSQPTESNLGMTLSETGKGFHIDAVKLGSSADLCDLRRGDLILQINGQSMQSTSLERFQLMLTEHILTCSRINFLVQRVPNEEDLEADFDDPIGWQSSNSTLIVPTLPDETTNQRQEESRREISAPPANIRQSDQTSGKPPLNHPPANQIREEGNPSSAHHKSLPPSSRQKPVRGPVNLPQSDTRELKPADFSSIDEVPTLPHRQKSLQSHRHRQETPIVDRLNTNLPCSHCNHPIGTMKVMMIESLKLYYHLACFACTVCGKQLGDGLSNTDVNLRKGRLFCHQCNRISRKSLSASNSSLNLGQPV